MKKQKEKILYHYDVGTEALIGQIFAGIIFLALGTVGWIMPIVDEEFVVLLTLTGIGYPISLCFFYLSFGFCRKYIVSDRSVSISKGFFTDFEFPADSIVAIKRVSFFSSITISTAGGRFTVFGFKDSKKCFEALKTVLYDRQNTPEIVLGTDKTATLDDELPEL